MGRPRGPDTRPQVRLEIGQNWVPTTGPGPAAGRKIVALWADQYGYKTVRYTTVRNKRKPEEVTLLIAETAFRAWIGERAAVVEAAQDAA